MARQDAITAVPSVKVLYEATVAFIRPNNEDVAYKNGTRSHPADVMCGDLSSVCGGYRWLLAYFRFQARKGKNFHVYVHEIHTRVRCKLTTYYFNIQLTILRIMWVPSSLSPISGELSGS